MSAAENPVQLLVGRNYEVVADDEVLTFGDMRAEIEQLRAESREATMLLRGCLGHYEGASLRTIAKDVTHAFHRMTILDQERRKEIRDLRKLVKEENGCCEGQAPD